MTARIKSVKRITPAQKKEAHHLTAMLAAHVLAGAAYKIQQREHESVLRFDERIQRQIAFNLYELTRSLRIAEKQKAGVDLGRALDDAQGKTIYNQPWKELDDE